MTFGSHWCFELEMVMYRYFTHRDFRVRRDDLGVIFHRKMWMYVNIFHAVKFCFLYCCNYNWFDKNNVFNHLHIVQSYLPSLKLDKLPGIYWFWFLLSISIISSTFWITCSSFSLDLMPQLLHLRAGCEGLASDTLWHCTGCELSPHRSPLAC